jgi:hypothetical protein
VNKNHNKKLEKSDTFQAAIRRKQKLPTSQIGTMSIDPDCEK